MLEIAPALIQFSGEWRGGSSFKRDRMPMLIRIEADTVLVITAV